VPTADHDDVERVVHSVAPGVTAIRTGPLQYRDTVSMFHVEHTQDGSGGLSNDEALRPLEASERPR
jgi:hypothetical protein